jgi:predicted  nucleic acid-binding Zn-ribbon protein
MEIEEAIRAAIKELILPDLDRIREESKAIEAILTVTNKRLDDVNLHLVDQSRRIDETNRRIDALQEALTGRIDAVREDLTGRIDETNRFIIETNLRLDRLYEVVVRLEEHVSLAERVIHLERDLADIKQKLAA